MKYYLIVGEASGDLHASNLMKALQQEDANANFQFWGGDLMEAVSGQLRKHYRELAFMGIVEVVKNLPTIARNMRFCKEDILAFRPDVLILVDYSGFNLRIAKWAKTQGIKVFYYIAPQIWASRPKRALTIKENVDQLFAILPFEEPFYQQYGMSINYVGHPLLDALADFEFDEKFLEKEAIQLPIIALLPGSRRQEIARILEVLLPLVEAFEDYQFVIAAAAAIPTSFYNTIIDQSNIDGKRLKLIYHNTYNILHHAQAAVVTSGTATLETALLDVPQVVCYKGSALTYQIVKRLIRVPYISLVNLIVDQPLVKELIQKELTTEKVQQELTFLLRAENRLPIKEGYAAIRTALGNVGASERTAKLMVGYLRG